MGKLFTRTNLLTRLVILVCVATLPAVGVTAYMQYRLRSDGEQRIADEALRQAELLNADMANVAEGARQLAWPLRILLPLAMRPRLCRQAGGVAV